MKKYTVVMPTLADAARVTGQLEMPMRFPTGYMFPVNAVVRQIKVDKREELGKNEDMDITIPQYGRMTITGGNWTFYPGEAYRKQKGYAEKMEIGVDKSRGTE